MQDLQEMKEPKSGRLGTSFDVAYFCITWAPETPELYRAAVDPGPSFAYYKFVCLNSCAKIVSLDAAVFCVLSRQSEYRLSSARRMETFA